MGFTSVQAVYFIILCISLVIFACTQMYAVIDSVSPLARLYLGLFLTFTMGVVVGVTATRLAITLRSLRIALLRGQEGMR